MKRINAVIAGLMILCMVQATNAQFLKKLKEKLMGREEVVPTQKISGLDQKFGNWNMGGADIIAISVFSDDFEKHRQQVGTIRADGSFDLQMPDSLKTWVPVSVYGRDCDNADEARIVNPETKLAWNRLFIYQDGEFKGDINPASNVKAAYNLNNDGLNNGKLGRYYLWVYADGNANAAVYCTKVMDVTDGKEYTYEDMEVKDNFDLNYKKGWNIVEVNNVDNIWVGLTKHYTEREWKVVETLPRDIKWVFRPKTEQ